jgi:tetratricopeptide (TPR) repeat protein
VAPADFPWAKYPMAESLNAFARGIGAAMSGNGTAARTEIARLEKLRDVAASRKLGYWAGEIDVQANVVRALTSCAEGSKAPCLAALRAAADREDGIEKHAVTPGRLVPAREVLAYAMLDAGDSAGALREFEKTLEREPNRLRIYAGASRAAQSAGNPGKASEYDRKLRDLTRTADAGLQDRVAARQLSQR